MNGKQKTSNDMISGSNLFLNEMLNQRRDSIWAVDHEFRYIFINDYFRNAYQRVYGIDLLPGMNALDLLTGKLRDFWKGQYTKCFSGNYREFEFSEQIDGQTKYFRVKLEPIQINNKIAAVSAIGVDITDQKEIEKKSEGLSAILEESLNEIYLFDATTYQFVYVNIVARDNLGYSKDELTRLTALDIKPEFDKNRFDNFLKPLKSGSLKKITFETIHQRKDKSLYPVEVHLQLTQIENKAVFVAIILDNTDKKQAENQIRETQIEYEKLLDQAGDAVYLADFETAKIIYTNKQGIKNLGYSREELLQMKVSDLDPVFIKNEHRRKLWNKLKPGIIQTIDVVHKRKDGSTFPVEVRTGIVNFRGRKAILGFARDISDWKLQKRELKEHRYNLEKLVAIRTSDLEKRTDELAKSRIALVNIIEDITETTENLRQANIHLDNVNKEMETFTYSVSHDLKSPIRAISGFTYLLRQNAKEVLDEKAMRYLNNIEANAHNMSKLIEDLLRFSRLSKSDFSANTVNMQTLFAETYKYLQPEKDSNVIFNLKPLPSCIGDASLLKQVIVNLLSNAIKFSANQATPQITIDGFVTKHEAQYSVSDNGVGFDMAYANKLFGVFQRLHSQDEFEGTGVGLAIVQKIIHRHGGKIWAKSKINKGASFYFTLPIHPA